MTPRSGTAVDDDDGFDDLPQTHLDDEAYHASRRAAAAQYRPPSWSATARAIADVVHQLSGS